LLILCQIHIDEIMVGVNIFDHFQVFYQQPHGGVHQQTVHLNH
jgi:hypothetical protein